MQEVVAALLKGADIPVAHPQYLPINLKRMQRIQKTAVVQADLLEAVAAMQQNVQWLVLTEFWCGDAAQILPLLQKVAEASEGKINLQLVFRDENPELMAQHLTNGGGAIPKLIQLDAALNITGTWGSRPQPAQELVLELKSNPATASSYAEQLHRWYAQDKTLTLQLEILQLIRSSLTV